MKNNKKFYTKSQAVAKRMCEILHCSCEAVLEGNKNMFTFYFPYTDEVVEANKQARHDCYDRN